MDSGYCEDGVAALRLLHYPPQKGGPPRIGAGAHTGILPQIVSLTLRFRRSHIVDGRWHWRSPNLGHQILFMARRQTRPR